jgi:hypothetical protein
MQCSDATSITLVPTHLAFTFTVFDQPDLHVPCRGALGPLGPLGPAIHVKNIQFPVSAPLAISCIQSRQFSTNRTFGAAEVSKDFLETVASNSYMVKAPRMWWLVRSVAPALSSRKFPGGLSSHTGGGHPAVLSLTFV